MVFFFLNNLFIRLRSYLLNRPKPEFNECNKSTNNLRIDFCCMEKWRYLYANKRLLGSCKRENYWHNSCDIISTYRRQSSILRTVICLWRCKQNITCQIIRESRNARNNRWRRMHRRYIFKYM